jgi:hypothetical protein
VKYSTFSQQSKHNRWVPRAAVRTDVARTNRVGGVWRLSVKYCLWFLCRSPIARRPPSRAWLHHFGTRADRGAQSSSLRNTICERVVKCVVVTAHRRMPLRLASVPLERAREIAIRSLGDMLRGVEAGTGPRFRSETPDHVNDEQGTQVGRVWDHTGTRVDINHDQSQNHLFRSAGW